MAETKWLVESLIVIVIVGFLSLFYYNYTSFGLVNSKIDAVASGQISSDTVNKLASSVVLVETANDKGTGFAITDSGYIATASHVVSGYSAVTVVLKDGTILQGNVLNTSVFGLDLAIIKVNHTLSHAQLINDLSSVKLGTVVYFIGYPLSSTNPDLRQGTISFNDFVNGTRAITINSFASHGDSGSPVFLADSGEVIGLIQQPAIPPQIQIINPNVVNIFSNNETKALAQLIVASNNGLGQEIANTYQLGLITIVPLNNSLLNVLPSQ